MPSDRCGEGGGRGVYSRSVLLCVDDSWTIALNDDNAASFVMFHGIVVINGLGEVVLLILERLRCSFLKGCVAHS
jgi:hypothetical protein